MKFCLYIIVCLVAVSCASTPPFQKRTDGFGYSVEQATTPTHFKITTNLPEDIAERERAFYVTRAIGEECSSKGYKYFDEGQESKQISYGFCYDKPGRKSLAVTFAKDGLNQTPQTFVIENLNQKSSTNLKVGDQILSIEGKPASSMASIKNTVYEAAQTSKKSLALETRREGKTLKIDEPLADMTGGVFDQEFLERARKYVP